MRWPLALIAVTVALAAATPASASDSVAYQLDAAHTGATSEPGLNPPFARRWAVDLGQPASYPVIVGGRVFVVARNAETYGSQLYALDAASGRTLWRRSIGGTYYWSGIAYGAGRLFTVDGDGLMMALDPATGAPLWSRQLPGQYSFSSEPTVSGNLVYAGGAGSGGTVYAVDVATGAVRWTQSVCCGDHSSPAIANGRMHVGYVCDTYGFNAGTGSPIWHDNEGCSGGGGRTTVVAGGRLYARDGADGTIFDAATGATLGGFTSTTAPAIAGDTAILQRDGTTEAVGIPAMTTRWSFSDGQMSIAPIIVNDAVIAGSATGRLYALDRASGRQLWCDDVGRAIDAPDEHNVSSPVTGLAAGGGLLVVPAGGLIVAYGSGPGGSCTGASGSPAPVAPGAPGPKITLRLGKSHLYLGQRTRIRGTLSGVPDVSGRRITLDADLWPFGTFRRAAVAKTDARGRFSFIGRPGRNTRLRARLGHQLSSRVRTVWADFPWRVRVRHAGKARPRVTYTVYAFRKAKVRRKRVYAYLAHGRTAPWKLVRGKRWQHRTKRTVAVSFRYPRGSLGKGDHWMLCVPERKPDAFGKPNAIDRICGRKQISRTGV